MLDDLLKLNALEILIIWAGFAVATGFAKAFVKGVKDAEDTRAGRKRTCEECNFTVVTNESSITMKLMDDHNERAHAVPSSSD